MVDSQNDASDERKTECGTGQVKKIITGILDFKNRPQVRKVISLWANSLYAVNIPKTSKRVFLSGGH